MRLSREILDIWKGYSHLLNIEKERSRLEGRVSSALKKRFALCTTLLSRRGSSVARVGRFPDADLELVLVRVLQRAHEDGADGEQASFRVVVREDHAGEHGLAHWSVP